MSIDRVLRAEMAALLGEKPPTPLKMPPMSPLMQAFSSSEDNQPSVFATTWSMLSSHAEPTAANESPPDDFSDVSAVLSGFSGYTGTKWSEDSMKTRNEPSSLELPSNGCDSNSQTVGPPSMTDSFHGIDMEDASDTLERMSKVSKRSSSKMSYISQVTSRQSSKVFIQSNSNMSRRPSEGLNGILQNSATNTTVGSTHRSAPVSTKGPRCAQDYVQMVLDSELDKKKHEIPAEVFRYEDHQNHNMQEKPSTETPVLRDSQVSPISKSFLERVNEQIMQIKYHQAKERAFFGSRGEPGCYTDKWPLCNAPKPPEIYAVGTEKEPIRTTIIDDRARIKVESEMQTETNSKTPSGFITPTNLESGSKMDSQLSLMAIKPRTGSRASDAFTRPFYPVDSAISNDSIASSHARRLRVHTQQPSIFSKFLNIGNAFGATKNGLQTAWNTAEEILCGYLLPPGKCISSQEVMDESKLTAEEIAETEDNVSVSILRLMGVPMDTRHAIYHEVLAELQAVNDFSVGTVQTLSNIIDWLCTGNHEGTRDLVAKTRYLATSMTEVDPDSEGWKHFERDLCIFTNAVVDTVQKAARTMSRQCDESCHSILSKLSDYAMAVSDCNLGSESESHHQRSSVVSFDDTVTARRMISENVEIDLDPSTTPAVISPMVTESEFDMPETSKTNSMTSNASSNGGCTRERPPSRIPIMSTYRAGLSPCPSKSDKEFSLNVLRSALRNAESRTTAPTNSTKTVPSGNIPRLLKSYTSQNERQNTKFDSSCCSIGNRSSGNNNCDPREQYLSPADAKLFAECKRLVQENKAAQKPKNSVDNSTTRIFRNSEAYFKAYDASKQSTTAVTEDPSRALDCISMMPIEVSNIASAIASVASSVTSALLGPSYDETAPIPPSETPFKRNLTLSVEPQNPTILDAIQDAAITASRAIFGIVDPDDSTAQSSSRFTISPELLSGLSTKIANEETHQSGHSTTSIHTKATNQPITEPAWELFHYIKQVEAKREQVRNEINGIKEISPPRELRTESSVTARLSKAALTGLFNAFKDAIPAPLISVNASSPTNKSPTMRRSESKLKFRTMSGHIFPLNHSRSSNISVLKTPRSPSTPMIRAPNCSEANMSRKEAEARMEEDIQYLEGVLNALMESSKTTQPPPKTLVGPAESNTNTKQTPGKSKIPMRATVSPARIPPRANTQRNTQKSSAGLTSQSFSPSLTKTSMPQPRARSVSRIPADRRTQPPSLTPAKAKISQVHRTQTRAAPLKAKVQVISATCKNPSGATRSLAQASSNHSKSGLRGTSSINSANSSYLELAKIKQGPQHLGKRDTGSYARMQNAQEGVYSNGRSRSNAKVKASLRPGKSNNTRDPCYRYDDGTYQSQQGSSNCSSTCSSLQPSNIPSMIPVNVSNPNTYSEDFPGNQQQIAHPPSKVPPLFFPPLERHGPISIAPLLVNPFLRLNARKKVNVNATNEPAPTSSGSRHAA